jgi:hypothetical protein
VRDEKGRFVHGHKPLNLQDKTTGKFVSKSQDAPEYELKSLEINRFLKSLETENGE